MPRYCNRCNKPFRKTRTYKNNKTCKYCFYNEQYKGKYVYIIRGENDKIFYVGQTTNYYNRLNSHISGSFKGTKRLFKNNTWKDILYLDVTEYINTKRELLTLEQILIELYNPECNTTNNRKIYDYDRLFEITSLIHSLEWNTYIINDNFENEVNS